MTDGPVPSPRFVGVVDRGHGCRSWRPRWLSFGPGRDVWLAVFLTIVFTLAAWASFEASREISALMVIPLVLTLGGVAAIAFLYAAAGSVPAFMLFLFVLIFVNDALFRVRDAGAVGLDWQNAMKMALWGAAAVIGFANLRGLGSLLGGAMSMLIAYSVFTMVSAIYSLTPSYSAATGFGMLALALIGVASAHKLSEEQILKISIGSLLLFILAGWIVYYAVPELGRSPFMTAHGTIVERLCGIAGQANSLGRIVAVFLGLCFLVWYRGYGGLLTLLPLMAIGMTTLLVADSRASLLAFIIAAAAVLTRRTLWIWGASILGGLAGLLGLLGVPLRALLGLTSILSRSGDPTELFTLTGRTEIWAFSWEKIEEQPWLGYGFNSSKLIFPQFRALGIEIEGAHNMLLQNLLSVGIIGTIPLVVLVIYLVVGYVRRPEPLRDFFFFFTMIYGITEAGAFGTTPSILTLFLFIGVAHAAVMRAAEQSSAAEEPPMPPAPAERPDSLIGRDELYALFGPGRKRQGRHLPPPIPDGGRA